MDFQANAEPWIVGRLCEVCDHELGIGDAIRYDGDADRLTVRVRCACCHDALEEAVRRAMVYSAQLARSCGAQRASDLIQEHARLHSGEVAA